MQKKTSFYFLEIRARYRILKSRLFVSDMATAASASVQYVRFLP